MHREQNPSQAASTSWDRNYESKPLHGRREAGRVSSPQVEWPQGAPPSAAPGSSAPGNAIGMGGAEAFALADHKHGHENWSGTPTPLTTAGGGTAGGASTVTRGDHTYGLPAPGQPGASNSSNSGDSGNSAWPGAATTLALSANS